VTATAKVSALRRELTPLHAVVMASWPPLVAWAAAIVGLGLTAYFSGHPPWHSGSWAHWDSGHYESIATGGYEVHRCAPGEANGSGWCGNAAWFPAYPWLLGGLHELGLPLVGTGVVVSWLFTLAALVVLWRTFLRELRPAAVAAGLAFAAWAPGQVYDFAVFPLSMLFFFTVAALGLLYRGRWVAAGLATGAATLTYPVGITVAVAAAVWLTLTLHSGRPRALAAITVPTVIALAVIGIVQRLQTGRWTAFFDVQRQYGHGLHDPFGVSSNAVLVLARTRSLRLYWPIETSLQTVIVALVIGVVLLHLALRRRTIGPSELLLAVWAVATWALPLTQANVSVWRSQAALAPLAVLVARLPRPVALSIVAALVAISVPMALLFFDGTLI
jgi:hypothetical protein